MKKPELLAPAGDFEKLEIALHYGADAVYLGDSRFSLRGKAGNFTGQGMADAIGYARKRGKKAYVTLNIFPHNRDLAGLEDHLDMLREVRPDAVILSDPGLFGLVRRKAPSIPVHVSTQANVTNVEAARFWQDLGAERIILSRELSLEEIGRIREETKVELEAFVHGSICISYSGRCYISSFLASRSANTGECTNSCRWNYALMEEKRKGEYLPVYEDERGTYLLSSKDLCMVEHLESLTHAGVDSFKIEGRMKGINYVAGVVKVYREAIDFLGRPVQKKRQERWLRELAMFSSRGYTTGMFFGKQSDGAYNFAGESYRMSHELVGVVTGIDAGVAEVRLRNRLDRGDPVEFLSPGLEERRFAVGTMRGPDGAGILSARNGDVVSFSVPSGVRMRDLIRRPKASGADGLRGSGLREQITMAEEGCL